jgi:hypothetical protein
MRVFCTSIGNQVQSAKSKDVYTEEGFPTGLIRERHSSERHHKTFFGDLQKKGLQYSIASLRQTLVLLYVKGRLGTCAT